MDKILLRRRADKKGELRREHIQYESLESTFVFCGGGLKIEEINLSYSINWKNTTYSPK